MRKTRNHAPRSETEDGNSEEPTEGVPEQGHFGKECTAGTRVPCPSAEGEENKSLRDQNIPRGDFTIVESDNHLRKNFRPRHIRQKQSPPSAAESLLDGVSDLSRILHYLHTGRFESLHLLGRGTFTT